MECKYDDTSEAGIEVGVLIETLWNVNLDNTVCEISEITVLIETLWNVNVGSELW